MGIHRKIESIPGPAGALEAEVETPDTDRGRSFGVVCHPHPLYGGTMTNKVVTTVARAFLEFGMPVARFNFRGVGASAGTYADGLGETDDALAVVQWMANRFPDRTLWLGGFSFGGAVAVRVAAQVTPHALVTVAPAIDRIAGTASLLPDCPWVILQGDQDDLVSIEATRAWVSSQPKPPRLIELVGAEHFFHRRLVDLRERITQWAEESKLI
jgi:alpha/beta superfamily hydrolase